MVALAPAEIARRLDHRFALLSGGARGAPARHQSLRALVEWSHDLLDLEERVLLRRLSVFRGGCDLLAVEQVADGADLAASRVASVLASLVSKSMVTVEHGPGSRFRLLETVQSYAAERLDAAGESDAVGAAHLRWCRGLPPESLVVEQENVREALGWAVAAGEVAAGLELAVQMTPFWLQRGHPSEGRHWLELLRERETRAAAWGPGLAAEGRLALAQGDLEGAAGLLADARPLVLADGSPEEVVDLLTAVGTVAAMGVITSRRVTRSRRRWGEQRTSGRRAEEARLLRGLGNIAKEDGDFEGARSLYEEALALARTTGATRDVAALLNNLGVVAKMQGALEDARSLFEESLVHKAPLGDRRGLAVSHSNLGAPRWTGPTRRRRRSTMALPRSCSAGSTRPTAWCSASGVSPRRRPCAGTRPSPSSSSPLMTHSAPGWAIPSLPPTAPSTTASSSAPAAASPPQRSPMPLPPALRSTSNPQSPWPSVAPPPDAAP